MPGEAYHIARCEMRGPYPCLLHDHDFAELFWVEDGEGIHDFNGTRRPLTRGTLVMLRPQDRHGFRNRAGSAFTIVNVAFPLETDRRLRARYLAPPAEVALSSGRLRWLRGWTEHLGRAPRTHLEIDRFLVELWHELSEPPAQANGPDWLTPALEKIREPQHFGLGTVQLAKLAGRTPQHVNAVLKAQHGLTATEVVNAARLEHAALQLRMSTQKIIEIALEAGFQNLGHFYGLFRQRFGVTPRSYRERLRRVVR